MPRNKVLVVGINMRHIFLTACLAMMSLAVVGCSTSYDEAATPGMSDPFEGTNRAIFEFNEVVNDAVLHPAIDGYRYVVPAPARTGVSNVVEHLKSPAHFTNQLLQGDVDGAGRVVFRTVVNTFVGFGGLFDFAAAEGYEGEGEDFGQTLAVWGVDHGPYIVVPLLGPSSVRDYAGYFVDAYADPLRFYADNVGEEHLYYTKVGVQYFELRNSVKDVLEELQASSIDYYASVRSSYYQARQAAISDRAEATKAFEDTQVIEFPEYEDF